MVFPAPEPPADEPAEDASLLGADDASLLAAEELALEDAADEVLSADEELLLLLEDEEDEEAPAELDEPHALSVRAATDARASTPTTFRFNTASYERGFRPVEVISQIGLYQY